MSNFTKLVLVKTDDFTQSITSTDIALYTKPSGTFDSTETSMYAEVIGLASTTGYGGASLGNQSERYLMAYASWNSSSYDSYTTSQYNGDLSNLYSPNTILNNFESGNYTASPAGHQFSTFQTNLEDDGKHFITFNNSNGNDQFFFLIVDKNSLGGGSGSSSSAGTSLISWAHSSQSETDPDTLIDWDNQQISQVTYTDDSTDWKTDLLAKVTAKGLNIDNLLIDYQLEKSIDFRNKNITFKDYVINKIN